MAKRKSYGYFDKFAVYLHDVDSWEDGKDDFEKFARDLKPIDEERCSMAFVQVSRLGRSPFSLHTAYTAYLILLTSHL
jgi:hypothetical protein